MNKLVIYYEELFWCLKRWVLSTILIMLHINRLEEVIESFSMGQTDFTLKSSIKEIAYLVYIM